jgi:hypothetical protein
MLLLHVGIFAGPLYGMTDLKSPCYINREDDWLLLTPNATALLGHSYVIGHFIRMGNTQIKISL